MMQIIDGLLKYSVPYNSFLEDLVQISLRFRALIEISMQLFFTQIIITQHAKRLMVVNSPSQVIQISLHGQ